MVSFFLLLDIYLLEQWSARMLSVDDTHCVLIFILCCIINMCELCAHLSYGALGQRAESNQDLADVLSMPKMVIFSLQYSANVSIVISAAKNSAAFMGNLSLLSDIRGEIKFHSFQLSCQKSPAQFLSRLLSGLKCKTPAMPYVAAASLDKQWRFHGNCPRT